MQARQAAYSHRSTFRWVCEDANEDAKWLVTKDSEYKNRENGKKNDSVFGPGRLYARHYTGEYQLRGANIMIPRHQYGTSGQLCSPCIDPPFLLSNDHCSLTWWFRGGLRVRESLLVFRTLESSQWGRWTTLEYERETSYMVTGRIGPFMYTHDAFITLHYLMSRIHSEPTVIELRPTG